MNPTLRGVAIGLVVLGLIFAVVEGLWPADPAQPRWRSDIRTDLAYWFLTPLVTKAITRAVTYAVFVAGAFAVGKLTIQQWLHPTGPIARQPAWLQALEIIFVGDLIGYWIHRLFHRRSLWPFHAIHHSSTQLDWLSSVRLHPVNDTLPRLLQTIPFFLMGFSPKVMVAYVPFLTFYAVLLHANVRWSLGPLRYVIASPTFHRWHHTSEQEGLDKNFAGLLAFLDLVFGTFYLPNGRQPQRFGVESDQIPKTVLGQLAYPFRTRSSRATPAGTAG
jgi:sterol desaturase/sphingolipid hydroxylase (fatty acid hydroxylase superfamily)